MKKIFLILSIAALSFFSIKASSSMLFPEYKDGVAILVGGARAITQFNYDKLAEHMLFIDADGRSMVLPTTDVVAVFIDERAFVPTGSSAAFNERIAVGDNILYVRHRTREAWRSASAAGANLETRRVNMTMSPTGPGSTQPGHGLYVYHRASSQRETSFSDESVVFIHDGDRFVEISSLRRLIRQFSPQRTQIEAFARRNNTDFRSVEDVKTIVVYALSL
jgi:hypothetical protein